MTRQIFVAILCMFVAVSHAASSCSASAALRRGSEPEWSDGTFNFSIYYLEVANIGSCGLNSIKVQFTLPQGAQISEQWGLNLLGNRVWELTNFGGLIAVGATYSSAGFTLKRSAEGPITVAVFNTSCVACDSTSSPTSSPSPAPSTAPSTAPSPAPSTAPTQPPVDRELITNLITAPSQVDRLNMLRDNQFVFDFKNSLAGITQSAGGKTVATSRSNFPAVIGHNIAMTVGYIEACGINLPHTHPRATEINFIAKGRFQAGFFMENQGRFIGNILETGMATVFPQGAIHFEINLECEPAIFVAAFNNEDPGVQTTAQSFFGLPADITAVSLNISSIQTVEDLAKFLPHNPAVAMQKCMERCGFSKK